MPDPATLEVVVVLAVSVLAIFCGIGILVLCHWDQRHDRSTSMEARCPLLLVRFDSEASCSTKAQDGDTSTHPSDTATQRDDDETAGARTLPFPSAAPPTQQDSPRYRDAA
jgi:hypothetical protein